MFMQSILACFDSFFSFKWCGVNPVKIYNGEVGDFL